MIHRAVDISNWQSDLTAEDVAAWRDAGIVHAIVRASLEDPAKGEIAQKQAQLITSGGLTLGAYVWAYFTDDPTLTVVDALRLLQNYGVRFWWVDCEEKQWIRGVDQNVDWLGRALASFELRQVPVGIYTRKDWWQTYMGNTARFANRPLLYAHYDEQPSMDDFAPFGGWTLPAGKQYTDHGQAGRLEIDLDILDDERLGVSLDAGTPPAPTPPPPPPPEPEKPALHFNPDSPIEYQDTPWDCAIATTAWLLQSVGVQATEDELREQMVPGVVTPALGLLAGNGTGLAAFLRDQYGLDAQSQFPVSWGWLKEMAGRYAMGMGGFAWYHWTGVRRVDPDGDLELANPAGRWMGVGRYMTPSQFAQLGPFAAVWLDVASVDPEEPAVIDALRRQLDDANSYIGGLTHDIIFVARKKIDAALQTDPPDETLLREARDLLKQNELGDPPQEG